MNSGSDNKEKRTESHSPVAIVGMACIFPKAGNLGAYWSNIVKKVDAITDLPSTHWKPEEYFNQDPKHPDHTYARKGGFISPVHFNSLEFGIAPNAVEATDTSQLLGLIVAQQALKDAGYGKEREFNRENVSVILGITGTLELVIPLGARLGHPKWRKALRDSGIDEEKSEEVVRRISDSYVGWQENSFPGLLGNVVAGRIANRLDFGGTNCVVDAACASSLGALHLSCLELTTGRSDMVITGGMDTFNDIFMYMCFSKTPVLSPTGHARPFDHKEDGTVLGEGVGVLILKRVEDAERDNDKIYAVIKGVGSSSDGKGNAIYMPTSSGQSRALKDAYKRAGVTPESIELVEAHGTGTRVGDATEVNALSGVYSENGKKGSWCALGSVKSQIGHTKAAAGIAGVIKSVMALTNKVLPPTIKVEQPIAEVAPDKTPFYINTESRPWVNDLDTPRRAAVSAFGFGGSNFHCVLEEYEKEKKSVTWDLDIEILAFSSSTLDGLIKKLAGFPADISWEAVSAEAARMRESFDSSLLWRMTMVVRRGEKTISQLIKSALQMLEKSPEKSSWSTPDNVFFENRDSRLQKLGLIFPGQGSQYCGMLRDLACAFPSFHAVLGKAEQSFGKFQKTGRKKISDYIYPISSFEEERRQKNELKLRQTNVAQPALGAVSLGAFRVLEWFGLNPHSFAGHSYGELTALCASGRVGEDDFFNLSSIRGELMSSQGGGEGAMIAVRSGGEEIEKILASEKLDLVIANRNSPAQTVLSGRAADVKKAADIFMKKRISHIRLPVSGAFHSKLVSGCREPFFQSVKSVSFSSEFKTVFSNTTGDPYPHESGKAKDLISEQLVRPVEFVKLIGNMYDSGITTFLEVGPGAKLSKLVLEILRDKPVSSLSLDPSTGGSGMLDLAVTLARLSAAGHSVTLSNWNKGAAVAGDVLPDKRVLTIPICGANQFTPGKNGDRTDSLPSGSEKVRKASRPLSGKNAPEKNNRSSDKPMKKEDFMRAGPVSSSLSQALRVTQEGMLALQKMQEETARLHSQFLQGQAKGQEALVSLMDKQHRLLDTGDQVPVEAGPSELKREEPQEAGQDEPPRKEPEFHRGPVNPGGAGSVAKEGVDARIVEVLLAVVSEKTGYPVEMLDLEMGMDSDLGIDSIKQVEILSALQEKLPKSPEVKPDQMGTLQTLNQLAFYLQGAPVSEKEKKVSPSLLSIEVSVGIKDTLLEVVSEKTGYPVEMLDLEMGMDSDLGIDSIKQVEILSALQEKLPDSPEVKPDQMGRLQTLQDLAHFLDSSTNNTDKEEKVEPGLADGGKEESSGKSSEIESVLLEVVSGKTGYPVEMLDLDMGMDSDLGIDSIKQVEILAALQEKLPDSPEVKPDQMGTLQTLRQLAMFLRGNSEDGSGDKSRLPEESDSANNIFEGIERSILVADTLDSSEEREEYLLEKGSAIWIISDGSELSGKVSMKLKALGYKPALLDFDQPAGFASPETLGALIIISPAGGISAQFYTQALQIIQRASDALRLAATRGGAVVMTVSRLDGSFGLNGLNADMNPLTGGLSGFTKTISHEWPEVNSKAIDLTPDHSSSEVAAGQIVDEMFKRGPVEVGISKNGLTRLSLLKTAIPERNGADVLNGNDVILITGGGRGVTADAAISIARAFKPRIILVGRTRLDTSEPEWLSGVLGERDIKKAIAQNSNGCKPTPKYVEKTYKRVVAIREIERTIQRVKDAGSEVSYISSDITDQESFANSLSGIKERFGVITGVIHGAGVLFDRRIEDKTKEQFEKVLLTKVSSLDTILSSLETLKLKILVLFSSSTGRFGRTGQVDYAVANEILNKIAQKQSRLLKSCKVVSFNWGPWDGGMVTPALKKIFRDEGVGLIDRNSGAGFLVNEIASGGEGPVEIVVIAGEKAPGQAPVSWKSKTPVTQESVMKRAFRYDLGTESFPFLASHIINGKPVVPVAMMIEWCAQGALHANPGLHFNGFNNFRVLKGVVLEPDTNSSIEIVTGQAVKEGDSFMVPVEIWGVGSDGSPVSHARGDFVLSGSVLTDAFSLDFNTERSSSYNSSRVYEILFHGEDFQSIINVEECSSEKVQVAVKSAPAPSHWIKNPVRNSWVTDPLVIDSAFQAMILWTVERYDTESLPCFVGRYRQYQANFPKKGVRLKAEVLMSSNETLAKADILFVDSENRCIAKIEKYECALSRSLRNAFNGH